jgi:hypothetical protein
MIKRGLAIVLFIGLSSLFSAAQIIYINNTGEQTSYDSLLFVYKQNPEMKFKAIPVQNVRLLPSLFSQRYELNKKYMMSLENDKLLQNFYYEAGIKEGYIRLNKDIITKILLGDGILQIISYGTCFGHWLSPLIYS